MLTKSKYVELNPLTEIPTEHPRGVLVVDDEHMNCVLVARFLERWGFDHVICVDNGESAIETLSIHSDKIGLMILDLAMRGMSGCEVATCARQQLGLVHLPIIALTARPLIEILDDSCAAGINYLMNKPFDAEVLRQLVLASV